MKSAAHRDAVVAKVQASFASYPSFGSLPGASVEPGNMTARVEDINAEAAYVKALFELFNLNPELSLVGRNGNSLVSA